MSKKKKYNFKNMFENCKLVEFELNGLSDKATDLTNLFNNKNELKPILSLEQIIEELWDKEPNVEKLSAEEVINRCAEKGWQLNLYNIVKIYEDCKKNKITFK